MNAKNKKRDFAINGPFVVEPAVVPEITLAPYHTESELMDMVDAYPQYSMVTGAEGFSRSSWGDKSDDGLKAFLSKAKSNWKPWYSKYDALSGPKKAQARGLWNKNVGYEEFMGAMAVLESPSSKWKADDKKVMNTVLSKWLSSNSDMLEAYQKSGSKQRFSDWLKGEQAQGILGGIVTLANSLSSTEGGQPQAVEADGDGAKQSTLIMGMEPLTFALVGGVAIIGAIVVTIAMLKNK